MLLASHNWTALSRTYAERAPFSYVVIDDFLAPQYAEDLHAELFNDGGWSRKNWQVGQLFNRQPPFSGLNDLEREMRDSFADVLGPLSLVKHWAVACHEDEGLHVHADNASVAVNLWLTPDVHNLIPGGSGLELFKLKREDDMMVHEFNAMPWAGEYVNRNLPARLDLIPYRYNRAIIFDASIFHATDHIAFDRTSLRTVRMGLTFAFDVPDVYQARMRTYRSDRRHEHME